MESQDLAALIGLDFDPDVLRARYRAERDKRLHPDGIAQYLDVKDGLSHYDDDPYAEPGFARDPVFDDVQCAVLGGGFGGLLMGARLREAGFQSIRIVELGADFGGTWYWNRYPGAMCDTESYCYLPLLEELGYIPKHRYSYGPEIFAHCVNIARHYRLYDDALLRTAVTGLAWNDATARWAIRTHRGDAFTAQFVALANGSLSRPKLPGIPGLRDFKGHAFHTSRWDYAYTGGDSEGNLTGLADKRVGIVGTGATAIQCIPHLGRWAKHLYVLQRTPSSVDARENTETDPAWAASLEPGWQKRRIENFTAILSGVEQDEDLVQDGWTKAFQSLTPPALKDAARKMGRALSPEEGETLLELADHKKMNEIRDRVDAIVRDPATAAALKPWYKYLCKRPCFHNDYLPTFNRPNVTLVDTGGKGVDRITAQGVVVAGKPYDLDCLIFATGFEVGTSFTRRGGYDIAGRDGQTLSEKWAAGLRTLHGFMSRDFPNCFFLGLTQTAVTINAPHMLAEQVAHVAYIVKSATDRGAATVEPTAAAEQAYVSEIRGPARFHDAFFRDCTPGYYTSEGDLTNPHGLFSEIYGPGPVPFFKMLAGWRATGRLEGLEMR